METSCERQEKKLEERGLGGRRGRDIETNNYVVKNACFFFFWRALEWQEQLAGSATLLSVYGSSGRTEPGPGNKAKQRHST